MFNKLGGRKLTCALIFGLLVLLNDVFGWGISQDTLILIGVGLGSFISVEGLKDVAVAIRGEHWNGIDDEDEVYDDDEK